MSDRPRVLVVRRRAAHRARAEGRHARGGLRGRCPPRRRRRRSHVADAAARPTRRSSTSCSPTATAWRSAARCASGATCRSSCSPRSATRTTRCAALEAGADDYVTKPFSPRELVARLQAALRRAAPRAGRAGRRRRRAEVDLAARIVRRDGEEVHLTPTEFDLLRDARPQPRAAADPPRAAAGGLGPGVRRRRADAAHAHRPPAPQDRARGRRRPTTSAPTRASATASTRSCHESSCASGESVMPLSRARRPRLSAMDVVSVPIAVAAFALLLALIEGLRSRMSGADLFGLIVCAAGLRLPPLRAAARGAALACCQGWLQIAIFLARRWSPLTPLLGGYMARVYTRRARLPHAGRRRRSSGSSTGSCASIPTRARTGRPTRAACSSSPACSGSRCT